MDRSKRIQSSGGMFTVAVLVVLGAIRLANFAQAVPTPDPNAAQQRDAVMIKEEDANMVQVKDSVTGRIVANLTGYVRYGDSDDLPLDIHSLTFGDGDAQGERIVTLTGEHVMFVFKYNVDNMQPGRDYFSASAKFEMHIKDQQDQELKMACHTEEQFYFESIGDSDYNCRKLWAHQCSTWAHDLTETSRVFLMQFELALISDPDHV